MTGWRKLAVWIANNPAIIIAALLLTIGSIHYAQMVESQGMTTDSSLYKIFSHLYQENFGTDTIVVLMEVDDAAQEKALRAGLRLSDHMKQVHNVISVQSLAAQYPAKLEEMQDLGSLSLAVYSHIFLQI